MQLNLIWIKLLLSLWLFVIFTSMMKRLDTTGHLGHMSKFCCLSNGGLRLAYSVQWWEECVGSAKLTLINVIAFRLLLVPGLFLRLPHVAVSRIEIIYHDIVHCGRRRLVVRTVVKSMSSRSGSGVVLLCASLIRENRISSKAFRLGRSCILWIDKWRERILIRIFISIRQR